MLGVLLLCVVPQPDNIARDHVEILERNSYYDENGRLVFVQIIGWQAGHVRFWKLLTNGQQPSKDVVLQELPPGAKISFDDNGILRQIWSFSYAETWTQFDPELLDRELLPKDQRQPLSSPGRTPCLNTTPR